MITSIFTFYKTTLIIFSMNGLKKISTSLLIFVTSTLLFAQQKNILFIAIDDLKPQLNCWGDSNIKSPNIDRLAGRGTVFTNAYCAWSVCGPSRASMLSGLSPDGTGIKNLTTQLRDVRPDAITLPQFFKNRGYETVGIGKVYDFRNVDDGHDAVSWTRPYIPTTKYTYPEEYGPFVKGQNRVEANTVTEEGPEGVDFDGYLDGQSCLLALDYIDEFAQNPDKPFFLAVGFKKPHIPFIAPKKYWDLYDRDEISLAPFQDVVKGAPSYIYYKPEPNPDKYVDIPSDWDYEDVTDKMDTATQKRIIHAYYACTSYIDDLVGMLLDKLEEKGLAKNTIIVLWGDHGYHLGDHNQWGKHTNFENGTHLPLIIAIPNGKNGVCYRPVDSYDIYPTLIDLAGYDVPEYLEGDLLSPVVKGGKLIKSCAVSQFRAGGHMGYSFRTERYRFTAWMDKTSYIPTEIDWDESKIEDMELYDYIADPLEKVNLVKDTAYRKVKDSLLAIAGSWWKEQHYFFTTGRNSKYVPYFNYLLNDPDFEEGITSAWNLLQKGDFSATLSSSSNAHSGANSAMLEISSAGSDFADGQLINGDYNCLSGIRGQEVIVSLMAKSTQSSSIKIRLNVLNFDGSKEELISPELVLTSGYDSLGYRVTIPESAADWELSVLLGKASGTVNIDDVRINSLNNDSSTFIKKNFSDTTLEIYPNPAEKYFYVKKEYLRNKTELNIYSLKGEKLISSVLKNDKIDISSLKKGVYLVEVLSDKSNRHISKLTVK